MTNFTADYLPTVSEICGTLGFGPKSKEQLRNALSSFRKDHEDACGVDFTTVSMRNHDSEEVKALVQDFLKQGDSSAERCGSKLWQAPFGCDQNVILQTSILEFPQDADRISERLAKLIAKQNFNKWRYNIYAKPRASDLRHEFTANDNLSLEDSSRASSPEWIERPVTRSHRVNGTLPGHSVSKLLMRSTPSSAMDTSISSEYVASSSRRRLSIGSLNQGNKEMSSITSDTEGIAMMNGGKSSNSQTISAFKTEPTSALATLDIEAAAVNIANIGLNVTKRPVSLPGNSGQSDTPRRKQLAQTGLPSQSLADGANDLLEPRHLDEPWILTTEEEERYSYEPERHTQPPHEFQDRDADVESIAPSSHRLHPDRKLTDDEGMNNVLVAATGALPTGRNQATPTPTYSPLEKPRNPSTPSPNPLKSPPNINPTAKIRIQYWFLQARGPPDAHRQWPITASFSNLSLPTIFDLATQISHVKVFNTLELRLDTVLGKKTWPSVDRGNEAQFKEIKRGIQNTMLDALNVNRNGGRDFFLYIEPVMEESSDSLLKFSMLNEMDIEGF
ncbi:MAG: hypothetical protein M1812_005670 [Candelaria pacifica]|nr:MAG: hypothetical protein M1812_005670 [Candelaria pacifica]